jgi:hypothetical protein
MAADLGQLTGQAQVTEVSGGSRIINTWTSGGGKARESYMPVSRGSTPP